MSRAHDAAAAGRAIRGGLRIVRDDLEGDAVMYLLREHLRDCHALSPPGSVHALDLVALRAPDITFWSAWEAHELLGCVALRELDPVQGEIKSMRTATPHLRKGVAAAMLGHVIAEADRRGYRRLSLETGSMAAFEPARRLYARHGFVECAPFPPYRDDPHSTFMTLELGAARSRSERV